MQAKSLSENPALGDFYGTGVEIWAGLAVLKKRVWADFEQLLSFMFSGAKKCKFFLKTL